MIDFKPMPHQLEILKRSSYQRDLYLAWDPGTGKTLATIQMLRARFATADSLMSTLILAPKIVLENWKREFSMYSRVTPRDIVVLVGSTKKRIEKIEERKGRPTIFILNYDVMNNVEILYALLKHRIEILVCDECFPGDTEILTDKGFIRFDQLKKGTPVAQYSGETEEISFVVPVKYIKKKATEGLLKIESKKMSLVATPGHDLIYNFRGEVLKEKFKDLKQNSNIKIPVAGKAVGRESSLTKYEKLMIALQADGYIPPSGDRIQFSFCKDRKINELLSLCKAMGIECKELNDRPGRRRFSVPCLKEFQTKKIYDVIKLDEISFFKAREIIEYMVLWDGYKSSEKTYYYSSADKLATEFYQAVCILAGYKSNMTVQKDERKDSYSDIYRLFISKTSSHITYQNVEVEKNKFQGYVYCVSVPYGNIVTRRNGKPIITGNCHILKNNTSKRAKGVFTIASNENCKHRYLLSGTPILNNAMDLFMQYKVMDGYLEKESTFGTNFFWFRNTFFEDRNAAWSGQKNHFPDWQPRAATYDEMNKRLNEKMMVVKKEEVLKDLPPLVIENKYPELSPEQKKAYKELKDEFVTYLKELDESGQPKAVVAKLAITKALRLQQVVTGFVKTEDGEEIEFKKVPRLDALKELLSEIAPRNKVIVWAIFKKNYEQIGRVCKELGLDYVELHGGTKDRQGAVDKFNNEAGCRVLIGHPGAGGIGINLVSSNCYIRYSRSFKLGDDIQSEARNHRKGSEVHDKITGINLTTLGTIDELVAEALDNKQNISDKILNWKDRL